MKQLMGDILVSAFVGMVMPGILLNTLAAVRADPQASLQTEPTVAAILAQDVPEDPQEEYLVGVVLAEMPASFETEALKAQAVVARTYAAKAKQTGGKHGDGSVCTDPSCCQGYVSQEAYLEKGGRPEDLKKVRDAVYATAGQVLTYEGSLIEATYFSCSGGTTEDAAAVWGTDFPYLRSVDSPGEEQGAHYRDSVTFTPAEVADRLGVTLSGRPEDWITAVTRTAGGGVDSMAIGGRYFTGTEIRQKLGLRSTAFTVTASESAVTIETRGYGHRVGMSQYGADAMAVEGYGYEEILTHYYQGTELVRPE